MTAPRIRVLVVDDSAFARKVVREVLAKDDEIEVIGIARDGIEGLEKIAELKPDVVTLDLIMPDLDGIGLLSALPAAGAPKVVIVSVSGSETEIVLRALELGAVDVVNKPTPLPTDRLYELSGELVRKVKMAAASSPRRVVPESVAKVSAANRAEPTSVRLVVIGTSTGGPQALTHLFSALPAGLPAVFAVALHIPAGYTAPLAERLSKLGGVKIVEAVDGMEVAPGSGVIAPGGMHLTMKETGGRMFARVSHEPSETLHHPSVDVLFASASELGRGALGVILTGMGSDGTAGSALIREAGGDVVAEAASSCVVYGMPRSVTEAGSASSEAPLEKMAELILSKLFTERARI